MFKDNLKYYGKLTVELNGIVLFEKSNLIVNSGKNLAASRLMSNASNFITHMAIGAGTVAPALSDTTLGNELARVATTNTIVAAIAQFETTFGPGTGTGTVTEAALLNAPAVGAMMSRVTFSPIPKLAADELKFTWTIEAQA